MLAFLLIACTAKTGGASALLRTDTEPVGDNCASGGVAVSSGTDDDGDGVLSDAEVDTTVYVCNGEDGVDGGDGGDDSGPGGDDGTSALISTSEEPAGENCPSGGVRIDTGLDDDGDGALDEDEIDDTEYVCDGEDGEDGEDGKDGASGTTTLAEVSEEPEGANCPYGGQRVDTGTDVDGDGELDDDEILSTSYVCNGSDGSDGSDGSAALVSTADEPAGANCAEGGIAVYVGNDDDGDGTLDSGEVDSTSYICDGEDGSGSSGGLAGTTVVGDYTVANSVDAALLDGVEQITGTLTIYGSSLTEVSLPDIARVGNLTIGSTSGTTWTPDVIDLPSLTTVDGTLAVYYVSMTDWSDLDLFTSAGNVGMTMPTGVTTIDTFNGLESVSGNITYSNGTGITTLDGFERLSSVGGKLTVSSGSAITAITGFESLVTVDELSIDCGNCTDLSGFGALETATGTVTISNADIADLTDFASLSALGGLKLMDLTSFTSLYQLTGLTEIGGPLTLNGLTALTALTGLNDLTTVSGTVEISDNSALTSLSALGNLTSAEDLVISNNDALTSLSGLVVDLPDDGTLAVGYNLLLTDISALASVTGSVQVLMVYSNAALTNLDGLDNITYVGYTSSSSSTATYIFQNAALTDITGLNGLTALGYGGHSITSNSALCTSLVTALYTSIGSSDILGTWTAAANKSGC